MSKFNYVINSDQKWAIDEADRKLQRELIETAIICGHDVPNFVAEFYRTRAKNIEEKAESIGGLISALEKIIEEEYDADSLDEFRAEIAEAQEKLNKETGRNQNECE